MTKVCTKCKTEKGLDNFTVHKQKKDGRSSWCKACYKIARRKAKDANPEQSRKRDTIRHMRNRGVQITVEEYERLHEQQKGLCAICGNPQVVRIDSTRPETKRLSIDHCHKTMKVRGLLCSHCNTALGGFRDNVQTMERAIQYLKQFQTSGQTK